MTNIDETAYRLAGIIGSEHFPSGDLAILRRWGLEAPPPLCFYRIAAAHIPPDLRRSTDRKWMAYCHALAVLAGLPDHNVTSIGAALQDLGFSDRRLAKLLAAPEFVEQFDRVVRWLAVKRRPVRLLELFWAIYTDGSDLTREKIARDYYNNNYEQKD